MDDSPDPLQVCPWCLADGLAFDRYGTLWSPESEFGELLPDEWDDLELRTKKMPQHFYRDVFGCTPKFITNNPIVWLVHCDEPAEFIQRIESYELIFECRRCRTRRSVFDID
jgi:uncharacterized protein CbrC (UPF0167 family)